MSMPFFGKKFTFTQPDGTNLDVMGWGDQHHAVFQTIDGFTVTQDPISGFYQYATVSADREDLKPSGMRPGAGNPRALGLAPNARISRAAAAAKAMERPGMPPGRSRWEMRRKEAKNALRMAMANPGLALAPPKRETVGNYMGLCVLVQFPDVPGTIPRDEVEAFCNQVGYSGFGNHGSVHDYFRDVSLGKFNYTNVVTPYYTAKQPKSYYTNESVAQPIRTRQLIKEALKWLKAEGFGFSKLTADNQNYVYATNVFYAGPVKNNWSKGLWPHAYHLQNPFVVSPGKQVYDYQITAIGDELTLGTFCHENGHMVCDYPDLYDYGYDSSGVGVYCLMCSGANVDPKNPTHIGAYLKYKSGWAKSAAPLADGMNAVAESGKNQFFLYKKSPTEYYIVENRERSGRDAALTSSGLAIWHIDETGDQNHDQMTSTEHYECSLVQADGANHLEENVNEGDPDDLFSAPNFVKFSDTTNPASKWWDGSSSKLDIRGIGQAGAAIQFAVKL